MPLQSPLAFPGRPPMLNASHPAATNLRMAPVAVPGGGMRDLRTSVTYVSAGQSQTEITAIGHAVYPGALSNSSSIAIPVVVPGEVLNEDTIAVIFQPRTPMTIGQGMVGDNIATGGGFKIQTGNTAVINFVSLGSVIWTVPAVEGNNYFAAVSVNKSRNAANGVFVNLTSGQLWVFTSGGIGGAAPTVGTSYNVITYNGGSGVNPGRVACASLSAKYIRLPDMLKWADDPWSLWYAPRPVSGIRTAAALAQPSSNAPALLMGV